MKIMKSTQILVLAAVLVILVRPSVAQSGVILGVLEDTPGDASGQPGQRDVRVLFKKVSNEWQAYPNDCREQDCLKRITAGYPRNITWTIAFDGNELGQVTSRTPERYPMYWRVGQQEITSKTPVPTVGKRSVKFGGFFDAAVYRPLVAISQANFRDPDVWRPVVIQDPAVLVALRKKFRDTFPKLCRIPENETYLPHPFDYHDADITVMKSYGSRRGWRVAQMHIEATPCEDTEAGFGLDDPWFAIDPAGVAHYLNSGMWLVDAGDYDGDGKSELVFSINQDNRGGYRIYYDGFKKSAEFRFSYH